MPFGLFMSHCTVVALGNELWPHTCKQTGSRPFNCKFDEKEDFAQEVVEVNKELFAYNFIS